MHLIKRFPILALLMALSQLCWGQEGEISGTVSDENGPLPFLSVFIKSLNKGVITNEKGDFRLQNIPNGSYDLTISGVGFETQILSTQVPGKPLKVIMLASQQQLSEVTVEGKSDTRLVMESPIKSAVINTQVFARTPSTMIELMNRSAGVRVRQTGGLGSNAGIIVNGFQDRAIRYFKDGIPMDYLGAGYNFSLVPVNQLERMEVYKGVLPVTLGADALGGGINMVSRKVVGNAIEASYEIASFNTHRANLNLQRADTTRHYFVGVEGFVNYSDNDYYVTPELIQQRVKLFHNTFKHFYGEMYGGVTDTRWADELRVGVAAYWINRQNQYGARMTQPFGQYTSEQYSVIPTLRYKKTLFNGRLTLDQFLEGNTISTSQVDTAHGSYNWYGEFLPSDSYVGEASLRGSLSDIDFSYFTSRTYASIELTPTQKLELNFVYAANKRVGKDPLGLTFVGSDRDILSVPAFYNKSVSSIGLESRFFDNKITNNFIVKYFGFSIDAIDADWQGAEQERTTHESRWGLANAIKYAIGARSFVRASAEFATRLPEQDELFGDGNLHVSNFALKPETSFNVNAGVYTAAVNETLTLELNAFYRKTRDLILNVPYNFLFNQNQNVDNVRGIGLEVDANYTILRWLRANGNFTYQDFRLFDTGNDLKEDSRLQNTPYFFANLGLRASADRLFTQKDRIDGYWYFSFVREYYLSSIPKDFEPDSFLGLWGHAKVDAPNIIPDQSVHTTGFTYFPFDQHFSVGMQVKNIFDARVYDNFRIQNPGRSFHLKLTYNL